MIDKEALKHSLIEIFESKQDRIYDDQLKNEIHESIDWYLKKMKKAGFIYGYEFDCLWGKEFFDTKFVIYESLFEKFEGSITGRTTGRRT